MCAAALPPLFGHGGLNWNSVFPFTNDVNNIKPNLYGIASDGGNTVVAVGQSGAILRCTVDHTIPDNWISQALPLQTNRLLTSVAYMNPGFIAVGCETNGGVPHALILTSADGATWQANNSADITNTANVLRGVAFGTSGSLSNVALAVGDSGQVLLGGQIPAKPNASVTNYFNSAEMFPNPVLLVTNFGFAVTVDWFAAESGAIPVASNTFGFSPTNRLPADAGAPQSFTYYAEARDLRTGFVSAEREPVMLTINPIPRPTLSFSVVGTNLMLEWVGAIELQSTTNLAPPSWTNVWSGLAGQTNHWTNSIIPPPDNQFFRLVSTNLP